MNKSFSKILAGYSQFREKYAEGDSSVMQQLADHGQHPEVMITACCDSRVDPSVLLQCDPGDLFIARNVANIIPPFESDTKHHGTSAALEFGICYLNVKHLIILGHSHCGGMNALLEGPESLHQNDFISQWVSLVKVSATDKDADTLAKHALQFSYQNCMTFPWIKQRVEAGELSIHLWFFDISSAQLMQYSQEDQAFHKLET
jgi:carbonic anhydrase